MAASLHIKSALVGVGLLATARFVTVRQIARRKAVPGRCRDRARHAGISGVMSEYEAALNASNADAVMALYTEDGVLMRHTANQQSVRRPCDRPMRWDSGPSHCTQNSTSPSL